MRESDLQAENKRQVWLCSLYLYIGSSSGECFFSGVISPNNGDSLGKALRAFDLAIGVASCRKHESNRLFSLLVGFSTDQ